MLVADGVVVNPSESPVVPARAEQDLSELGLSVVGADWGESASGQSGSEPKTRTIVLDLICREDSEATLAEAAYRLQQIVGQMQEEPETWIKRVPKVGDFAGPGMYRIRRSPTAEEPQVTLSGLGGWQVGDNQPVTLTMVADFPLYSTEEKEGEKHSATTTRQLIYTEPASEGSTRGLRRIRVTNDNESGDWRGLIFASECRDYSPDETAELAYLAKNLTPKGGAEVKTVSGAEVVQHSSLSDQWLTVLSSEISGGAHLTHRGGRRLWVRVEQPTGNPSDVQLRLHWRALGSSHWDESNAVASVYAVGSYVLLDLGSCLPSPAIAGEQRWEWKLLARSGVAGRTVRIRDVYPLPTEQYLVLSEPEGTETPDLLVTKSPGTAVNQDTGGVEWTNPGNAKSADNSYASVALTGGPSENSSDGLVLTNFGFSIPSKARILGIVFSVEKSGTIANLVKDTIVLALKAGAESEDRHSFTFWPGTDEIFTYGGSQDLWGLTWTPAEVNSSSFGLAIICSRVNPSVGVTARIDGVSSTVYYTETPGDDKVCFASRSVEMRTDSVVRQHAEDEVWGRLVPDGFYPYGTPGALEGLTQRTILVASQGDLSSLPDSGSNKLSAQEWVRPGFHVARDGA